MLRLLLQSSAAFFLLFFSLSLNGQTLQGSVTGDDGQPLPGANVVMAGSDRGTVTDADGKYILRLSVHGTVEIKVSFMGYLTARRKVDFSQTDTIRLDVQLERDAIMAEPVEIRADAELRPMRSPVRLEVITAKQIEALPVQSIDQAMITSPGVNVNRDYGIYSDKAVVSLRGQSGSDQARTLVLVDGVPVNKSDGGSVNWNFIQPELVERIEITKGPASAMYGSNAMGGAINIITSRPQQPLQVVAEAEAGQWKTLGGRLKVAGTSADTSRHSFWYEVNGLLRRSDGYINQPEETILQYDSVVVPSFLREEAAQAKVGTHISANHQIEAEVSFYNDKRGRGIKIYEDDGSWSSHQTIFSKVAYNGLTGKTRLRGKLFLLRENYYRVNEYFSDGEYILYDVVSKRNDAGFLLNASRSLGSYHQLTWGGEVRLGSVDAADIYYTASDKIDNAGKMDMAGLFVMDEITLIDEQLRINAGVRLDGAYFHDGVYTISDPSYSLEYLAGFTDTLMTDHQWFAVNPKLSASWLFDGNTRIYVSAARGFRAPVLDDLCRSGRRKNGFRIANPDLSPEHLNSFELGFDRRSASGWYAGITAFYSHGTDYMYAVSTGDSVDMGYTISPVYQTQNIGGVEIAGIEAEVSGKITKNILMFANYTRNYTRISDFTPKTAADPDLTGNHLTDVPDHQANAGINWINKWANVNVTGKYTGKRWINDRNIPDITYIFAPQYPAWFNIDIKIQKQISKHWLVSLSVQNLFDEVHINDGGYKTPSRFIIGKIAWQLF
jgi:iron complex outermembrane receptor protein